MGNELHVIPTQVGIPFFVKQNLFNRIPAYAGMTVKVIIDYLMLET